MAPTGTGLCGLEFWERSGRFDLDGKTVWEHDADRSGLC